MTEQERGIQDIRIEAQRIREDYEYLTQSETVRFYLRRGVNGRYINDIFALDRGIRDLHKHLQEAEKEAQLSKTEAFFYRRKMEALEIERREEEENRFPLFYSKERRDEDQHPEEDV